MSVFIELLFTDQWHAIPVGGPGSLPLPPPPFWGKKRKELRRKKSQQGKQNKTTPPPGSRSETATEYAYKHYYQFKFNDKAIIEIELVVTKCSVCKCLAYHYGNNNYVQRNHLRT